MKAKDLIKQYIPGFYPYIYLSQIRALVDKSFLLQFRQWKTNLVQFLFPLFIIILIVLLQLVFNIIRNRTLFTPFFVESPSPVGLVPILFGLQYFFY
jgi:hypothetical protein